MMFVYVYVDDVDDDPTIDARTGGTADQNDNDVYVYDVDDDIDDDDNFDGGTDDEDDIEDCCYDHYSPPHDHQLLRMCVK